jgi:hypothetical protein
MLAFDVQVQEGVLQIMTAGAGTAHRMPPEQEYLHCVQLAIDEYGLRYQVLDEHGRRREWLSWPLALPADERWHGWEPGADGTRPAELTDRLTGWRLAGVAGPGRGPAQTLISGWPSGPGLAPLWIGFEGAEQRLVVQLSQQAGRSPHRWLGPCLPADRPFELTLVLHPNMGPGGILTYDALTGRWSSWRGASAWGVERLPRLDDWSVGHGQAGPSDRPFDGHRLSVAWSQWPLPPLDG